MAIEIVEIHPAEDPTALNTEWFMVENRGEKPFNTRNCALEVSRKGSKKRVKLGTLDPGFTLAPGQRVRVITGTPGRKAHGTPPADDVTGYNLFLNASVLRGAGTVLTLTLRSHPVTSATYDPDAPANIATARRE